ncbi:phosphotransferase [Shewanella sp. JBTF-M18]|uniref:Phosphotransferase n=1 Tax=Shewanella insulae TaxID=2681496 RepID=A0A6L7HSE0_9GAMM|nr:phosphotransferase [Shewanella insulae]MXR67127.1 phosphotransferase [Shewanella insulae]
MSTGSDLSAHQADVDRHESLRARLPEAVNARLAELGCPLDERTQIQVLSRGLSNQNYHLTNADNQLVLRVNSQASSQISARDHEVANWRMAEQQGIAPELVYVSPDNRFYLSRFIDTEEDWSRLMTANPAHPLQDECVTRPGAEVLLLDLLKGLGHLPLPENPISVTEQWLRYYRQLAQIAESLDTGGMPASYLEPWHKRWLALKAHQGRVEAVLEQLNACELAPQYSHRDLNPHNLLVSQGKLWCIDYEYACSSHPLVDLASVLATHRLSTEQRHRLILGYLNEHPKLNDKALAAIPCAMALYWYFAACWALLMASQGEGLLKPTVQSTVQQTVPLHQVQGESDASLPHSVSDYLQCFDDFMVLIA